MKTLICTFSVAACLFSGLNSVRADAFPPVMPKWVSYYYGACSCYNMGVFALPNDPQLAIVYFKKAEVLAEYARAGGGGTQIVPLLLTIEKAAMVAQNDEKSPYVVAKQQGMVRATRLTVIRTR